MLVCVGYSKESDYLQNEIRNIESCTYTTFKFNFELRSIFSSKSRIPVYFDINLRLKLMQLTYTKFPVKKF